MTYLHHVVANLFPVSVEQGDLHAALAEWQYHGDTYDLGGPVAKCGLCDHPNIRYRFEIVNSINNKILLIGSECITKFPEIGVVDQEGVALGATEASRKVLTDQRNLIRDAKFKSVIKALIELTRADQQFDINSFINYYRERKAFTPDQLLTVLWRLEEHNIAFDRNVFRMIINRNREKEQLLGMKEWKIKRLWPCMSGSQKKFYQEKK